MKIITNTAMSLDGRINANAKGRQQMMGSENDLKLMSVLRSQSDAILIGGETFRRWPIPSLPNQKYFDAPLSDQPIWNVIVSNRMKFDFTTRYREETKIKPLFLTSNRAVSKKFPFPVLVARAAVTPPWIVAQLAKLGVQNLLIEAGGNLIYQFLRADLIDELYVTLCPTVIGDQKAPAIVSGTGFPKKTMKRLKLLSAKPVGDEVYLHYLAKKS
jgi:5-amino-6-(5-phosphoribosylamino)uracil reductase